MVGLNESLETIPQGMRQIARFAQKYLFVPVRNSYMVVSPELVTNMSAKCHS